MPFTPSGLQWAYSASGDEKLTLGAKRFTNETTNTTTGSTTIPEVTVNPCYAGQYHDKESDPGCGSRMRPRVP